VQTVNKIVLIISLLMITANSSWATKVKFDFVVTPIAKNVYSIVSPSLGMPTPENKGWVSNSHFVVTKQGVLLFDTGASELIGNEIKKAIKSVTQKPVRWVVNSHSHADHWLGNAAFEDTVNEIISSKHALAIMKKYGPEDVAFYSRVTKGTIGDTSLVYPSVLSDQNTKRNFGGVEVVFIFSNDGHSPGDIMMWLPEQEIIFGGDVLSSNWMPIITGHGNVLNLINTLGMIEKLKPKIVLTGHGNATTSISILRDKELLSAVWQQVKEGVDNGKSLDAILLDVTHKLSPEYRLSYQDFDSEIERHVKLMYKQNE